MLRCIELGKNGLGSTYPNPMVGSVIVTNNTIIGEGFTSAYGGNHAEVNAINSVRDKSLFESATIYVSLEPCSHYGKTPPCADLIIKNKIKKVVIGCLDPHEKVAGKGIQKLRDAGCEVEVKILEKECREHHRRFLTFHEKKRPYIILKWAETLDSFIAPDKNLRNKNSEPFWITNKKSRQLVHQWRAEEHAILVGTNTVTEDNPKLNVRDWEGNSPIRIVIDKDLKIAKDFNVLDGSVKTLVLNSNLETSSSNEMIEYLKINFANNLTQEICTALYRKNIVSLIVEGGAKTLQTFIDANIWDEARIFKGSNNFEKGLKAPTLNGNKHSEQKIVHDTLTTYRND
ncbi:bifunctional diaminohydroxyphosphoribosylaminopyrimidine deaminase/5-amino-6-(5-phosphoribosylamino)uracil reductase RibD [Aurantibacter crassamenti]|uniref:bifunctional diaminohydroxyphosphoribosylaminopyrimidine deaminase/5-amino-6-(5-phosphoribosylamino)uracil reductase RibD n=1 Tax=Aurantibacter crassamenti TaxID=1837375 RepID=UPI001EED5DA5|nr:bifunctional diaminohydroxyphosphoribosylaminopyrimidine deaminase/5-amino-6-(5-phosphoribosylamino)uracil reductase RibD [Aurantibacter crassamenti]